MSNQLSTITNIVFIDAAIPDYQTLIAGLPNNSTYFVLDAQKDGIEQIEQCLAGYSKLDSIQILSHGSQGSLYLGNAVLSNNSLKKYQDQLTNIGSHLKDTGDILLYGCNVAEGDTGLQFIDALAKATGADVAASNNITGSVALGGNWQLEASTGSIEAAGVLSQSELISYTKILLADTTAPRLTSLSIPTSLDLSKGTAGLTISGTATDDNSGVKQMVFYFDKSISNSYSLDSTSYSTYSFIGNYGITDSWSDGVSTQTFGIPSYNPSGVYNVTSVSVQDNQGNSRSYSATELKGMGVNTAINFLGSVAADTTAPRLTSLSIPTSLDLSKGTAGLTISGTATDDNSGVKQMVFYFDKSISNSYSLDSTSYSTYSFIGNYGITDSWSDGVSTQTFGIPSYNPSGVYNVTSVSVQDNQGNSRSYSATELKGMGVNTAINFTDGVSIQNALTATPSMEQGKIILSLSAAQWSASSNSLAFTLAYDSSVVHFDSWRAGSSGSYAVSSSILEVGASATVSMTGSINNSGDKTDFLQLVFTTTAQQGNFAYNFSSETLNSQTLANVSGNYSFSVVDAVAPFISIFNPTDEATGIAISSNIVLAFSEAIKKGTGTIAIHSGSAAVIVVESFNAATSNRLTISGNILTINPTNNLANNTHYFVTFASGTVKDLTGNSYAGTSIYDFTTVKNTITGTTGNDKLVGTIGDDILNGGAGADKMTGGLGKDIWLYVIHSG